MGDAALKAMIEKKEAFADAPTMNAEELIGKIKEVHGLDYDKFYQEDMDKMTVNNKFLANWKREDFKHTICVDIVDGKDALKCDGEVKEAGDVGKMNASDKMALQTYGRPYTD